MLDLPESEREKIVEIISSDLPGCRAWCYGSRAKGRARETSDLDIALKAEGEIPLERLGRLIEALQESEVNVRIDLIDLEAVSPRFRALIEPDFIPLI